MPYEFQYDVFLSHSAKDKAVVRDVAERLRKDGVKVWFDEWVLRPGDSIPAKMEEGLERSRVLVICMSANAFGSDWAQLESGTFRFRDPLNKERRFIPLRLDDAPIKRSLAQFLYIDWLPRDREHEYAKLLNACRPSAKSGIAERYPSGPQVAEKATQLEYELDKGQSINAYAFSPDGKRALSGASDRTVRLWDVETGSCLRVLKGHTDIVWSVAWSADLSRAISGSSDQTLRVWDIETGRCLQVLRGHTSRVVSVVWSADQSHVISGGGEDNSVRVWDVQTGQCLQVLEGHSLGIFGVSSSADQRRALSGAGDDTVRLWDLETGRCLKVFEGHTSWVWNVEWSADQSRAVSVSDDQTLRLWDVETGHCLRVLEGHTAGVLTVAWNADQLRVVSGSHDHTVRLWDAQTGRCFIVLEGHKGTVRTVMWSADQERVFSGDENGEIRIWNLTEFGADAGTSLPPSLDSMRGLDQVQYTNAKVLLVGDSGAGKTALSKRLGLNDWQPTDSTVGAWATQWKLPVSSREGVEREIWLWDFGGQSDQRLIHQLYMDETALAVLVFDGQKEELLETLAQWDRDLTRASRRPFAKLLVAGRIDAGGLRISRLQIEAFAKERGYTQFLETSAKANLGCEELRQAIINGIRWDNIPWRTSPILFKRLREEIVRLKDEGRVLMRFNELREFLQLRLSSEIESFTDDELHAVVSLLTGPGVVWELKFGSWVLLQPEQINAYAQAVIHTMRADEDERGCISEERVLNGDLGFQSWMKRLGAEDERFVLLAMHQTLVERGLCLRQQTERGALLVFPSYYRRERKELVKAPAVLVSYRFTGFLDEIYATLVVRLHHTQSFEQAQLWRYAADFRTHTGKQMGVKLTRRAEGAGELEVYFDPTIDVGEKILFSKYVHEHLLGNAQDVVRLRHYVCPHCGTPVANRETAMKRLEEGKKDVLCVNCEGRVPLWDRMEELFASPDTKNRVRALQEQSAIALDNESKERALVGEVISTVSLAGQTCREFAVSDHGIDMEIEFKSDTGETTGLKLFLQLKLGDAFKRRRKPDGTEVLLIKNESHSRYRSELHFPVMFVYRGSRDDVCWMELRSAPSPRKRGAKVKTDIVLKGETFDVASIRRWRERVYEQANELAKQRIAMAGREKAVHLSLSGLRLTELPKSLWRLTTLESLDLSANRLTTISEAIGHLTHLATLNLSRNHLNALPNALSNLTRTPENHSEANTVDPFGTLRELFLHENTELGIPREILGPTWEETHSSRASRGFAKTTTAAEILEYYFSTRGDQGRPLREIKLIVVGRGGAGKTSLIRRLKGEPLKLDEPETHGISIRPLSFACSDGPVNARAWDFGGQHILHAMHEFFLTARSVYLIVLGERDDLAERDAAYWLQIVRSYAGTSPIVVALNKSQGYPREMDRKTLEQDYGPIVGWVPTECDPQIKGAEETIETLRAELTKAVDQMSEIRDLFPAAWWKIKKWLEEMSEPYLDFDLFYDRCRAYGEHDEERQEQLSAWLHDLGIALNYARDPRLHSTTVLRPEWLANGIYALLRANDPAHREKLAPDAILTNAVVGEILADADKLGILKASDYPAERWPFLLQLMSLFQLAYPLDEKATKLLVPALLSLEPPAEADEPLDSRTKRLRYEFRVVPAPLMPRFLVRTFSLISDGRLWRRGAILGYGDAVARIWSTQDERWIYVTASGAIDDRDELLTIIRGTFSDLFEEYNALRAVEQWEFDGQWVPLETLDRHVSGNEPSEEVKL